MHKFIHLLNTYDLWVSVVEFDEDDNPSVDAEELLAPIFEEMGCEYHYIDFDDPDKEEIPDIIPENTVYHLADSGETEKPDTFYFGSEIHYNQFKKDFPTDNKTAVQLYLKEYPSLGWHDFPNLTTKDPQLFNSKMARFLKIHKVKVYNEEELVQNHVVNGIVTISDLSKPTVVVRLTRFGSRNDVWFINCKDLAALFKLTYG